MDKSYLLHNLKIVDNAEEDHGMLDLEFQNIRYEDYDLIADVIETSRFVGNVNPGTYVSKHENVNLYGSGTVLQDFKIVTITAINNGGSGKTITVPKLALDPPRLSVTTVQVPIGTSEFHTVVPTAAGYTVMSISADPTDYTAGIQHSGPNYQILPTASNETLTWG